MRFTIGLGRCTPRASVSMLTTGRPRCRSTVPSLARVISRSANLFRGFPVFWVSSLVRKILQKQICKDPDEHCLLYLHKQLTNRTSKRRFLHHQHCLNYSTSVSRRCATPTSRSSQETSRRASLRWTATGGRHTRTAISKRLGTTTQGTV